MLSASNVWFYRRLLREKILEIQNRKDRPLRINLRQGLTDWDSSKPWLLLTDKTWRRIRLHHQKRTTQLLRMSRFFFFLFFFFSYGKGVNSLDGVFGIIFLNFAQVGRLKSGSCLGKLSVSWFPGVLTWLVDLSGFGTLGFVIILLLIIIITKNENPWM